MDSSEKESEVIDWFRKHNLIDDLHAALQKPKAYQRILSGISGWGWEDEFSVLCLKRELRCEEAPSKTLPWDWRMPCQKLVQCKLTSLIKRADIRSHKYRNGTRRYTALDFDILALKVVSPKGNRLFFIPSTELVDPLSPDQSLLYSGIKLEEYISYEDAWQYLET